MVALRSDKAAYFHKIVWTVCHLYVDQHSTSGDVCYVALLRQTVRNNSIYASLMDVNNENAVWFSRWMCNYCESKEARATYGLAHGSLQETIRPHTLRLNKMLKQRQTDKFEQLRHDPLIDTVVNSIFNAKLTLTKPISFSVLFLADSAQQKCNSFKTKELHSRSTIFALYQLALFITH
ncbi:hypothetical protein CHUAL_006615 [Chamberlinius hualienensis]